MELFLSLHSETFFARMEYSSRSSFVESDAPYPSSAISLSLSKKRDVTKNNPPLKVNFQSTDDDCSESNILPNYKLTSEDYNNSKYNPDYNCHVTEHYLDHNPAKKVNFVEDVASVITASNKFKRILKTSKKPLTETELFKKVMNEKKTLFDSDGTSTAFQKARSIKESKRISRQAQANEVLGRCKSSQVCNVTDIIESNFAEDNYQVKAAITELLPILVEKPSTTNATVLPR